MMSQVWNVVLFEIGMLLVFRYFVGLLLAFECCSNPIISQCWIKLLLIMS